MDNKVKLMVVEDNKLIRVGIRTVIEENSEYTIIAEAASGKEAVLAADIYKPDIIILDLGLADMSGIKVITKLQTISPHSKIIILTSHEDVEEVNKCLMLGVYAYVIKDTDSHTLMNVIKSVNKGAMWLDAKIVPLIRNQQNKALNKIPRKLFKSTHSNLTQREFEVLKLIVEGKSNAEIAQDLCISEHTAKAHVCNIIQKLVVDDRTQAAVKALKDGIIQ